VLLVGLFKANNRLFSTNVSSGLCSVKNNVNEVATESHSILVHVQAHADLLQATDVFAKRLKLRYRLKMLSLLILTSALALANGMLKILNRKLSFPTPRNYENMSILTGLKTLHCSLFAACKFSLLSYCSFKLKLKPN